jgi:hypothetical protein
MTTTQIAYAVHEVPDVVLADVRSTGRDVSGNTVVQLTAEGGEPLRCCLRDAQSGEQLMLFGYEPELPPSPYREVGAIFAHAQACEGPGATDRYPSAWRGRPQVLRAYDQRGWIRTATVHDGSQPDTVIADMLADPEIVQVHSRNVAYGCFMFQITRQP